MKRRKSTIFFVVFGVCLIALAVALNVGWILLNLQQIALLVLGIIFFATIITGLVLNTTFLVREIRRNEQQNAFLNAVTHELKTPIASIRLYLETVRTRELSDEKRNEFYDVMLADSDRLLATVEKVLEASRSREKDAGTETTDFDLLPLLNETAELVRTRAKLEPDSIKLIGKAENVLVKGDEGDLRTVFTNLLDNAVKYSEKGHEEITIKVRPRVSGWVDVFVRDRGIGIPQSETGRIFKRFYRVSGDEVKTRKGTGLGLYIVRSLVKKHGGKISASSGGPGKGALFTVRLPGTKS
ncbi:MAG: HAMP domain-containing sensor histidine kinase [Pyrinomonadaceae bacterium]